MRAWPGEHDGRVRAWAGSRRRRAGTGRAPLVRRCGRRVSRCHARPHHGCIGTYRPPNRSRALAGGCRISMDRSTGESSVQVLWHRRPEASRCSPPLPGRADHHRDEGRSPRNGAGPGSRGPGRIGGRSRVCGIGWPSGDSSCAGGTASLGQQRVPLGNPPCSLSLMGALACSSNGVWRVSGAGDRRHDSRRIAHFCEARTPGGARGASLDRG